ncbi:hypothetical protein BOH78_3599 [Pichia kudriavzevii]|uniref:Uncharacterized protein n=1 Tax=Pichia kudriavzevii TaxID=4909 RepID=A0A1V2LFQ6_PICKU|nr:hypothetical protein BOH78_5090 [Pichia kudriavzevii]ONH70773.1 hypothetical protein BOH78_4980 [Pichia kudriavzevii]ONH72873.1 hypothetical protein BOH78_3599 [Pichia kudriavzevii]
MSDFLNNLEGKKTKVVFIVDIACSFIQFEQKPGLVVKFKQPLAEPSNQHVFGVDVISSGTRL